MKKISLLAVGACMMFVSCKKTYQCTCPTFFMGPAPYIIEVKASSPKAADKKCIQAGEKDPLVMRSDAQDCRILN